MKEGLGACGSEARGNKAQRGAWQQSTATPCYPMCIHCIHIPFHCVLKVDQKPVLLSLCLQQIRRQVKEAHYLPIGRCLSVVEAERCRHVDADAALCLMPLWQPGGVVGVVTNTTHWNVPGRPCCQLTLF